MPSTTALKHQMLLSASCVPVIMRNTLCKRTNSMCLHDGFEVADVTVGLLRTCSYVCAQQDTYIIDLCKPPPKWLTLGGSRCLQSIRRCGLRIVAQHRDITNPPMSRSVAIENGEATSKCACFPLARQCLVVVLTIYIQASSVKAVLDGVISFMCIYGFGPWSCVYVCMYVCMYDVCIRPPKAEHQTNLGHLYIIYILV